MHSELKEFVKRRFIDGWDENDIHHALYEADRQVEDVVKDCKNDA